MRAPAIRLGLVGAVLALAVLAASGPMATRAAGGFRGGVALYPGCAIGNPRHDHAYRAVAPLLILAGELDDWTPARPRIDLAAVAKGQGATFPLARVVAACGLGARLRLRPSGRLA